MQFPDPHWKLRNRKKRIVQPQLVEAVTQLIAPGGQVFLQSDVQEVQLQVQFAQNRMKLKTGSCRFDQGHALQVVASMRDDFEFHGHGRFEPDQAHCQQNAAFFTDQMTVAPLAKESLERQAWHSTWQAAGWLHHNPLVSNKRQTSAAVSCSYCTHCCTMADIVKLDLCG